MGELTPKVSSPLATVTLLLLASGPSVNSPGPGRFEMGAAWSGEGWSESPASEIEVGVAVWGGGGEDALRVRIERIITEYVQGEMWMMRCEEMEMEWMEWTSVVRWKYST